MMYRNRTMNPPLFFRVFFGVVLTIILAIWCLAGYLIYVALAQPEMVGQHLGRAVSGFIQEVSE